MCFTHTAVNGSLSRNTFHALVFIYLQISFRLLIESACASIFYFINMNKSSLISTKQTTGAQAGEEKKSNIGIRDLQSPLDPVGRLKTIACGTRICFLILSNKNLRIFGVRLESGWTQREGVWRDGFLLPRKHVRVRQPVELGRSCCSGKC